MTPKFRAWHKIDCKMYAIKSLNFDPTSSIESYLLAFDIPVSENAPCGFYALPAHIELMQWAGIKDYEGRDIYQDDIVSVDRNYSGCEGYPIKNYRVMLNDGAFSISENLCLPTNLGHAVFSFEVRVIGNIYHNPELLDHSEDNLDMVDE